MALRQDAIQGGHGMSELNARTLRLAYSMLAGVDPGFRPDQCVLATIDADGNVVHATSDPEEIAKFMEQSSYMGLNPHFDAFKEGAKAFEPTLKEMSRERLIALGY